MSESSDSKPEWRPGDSRMAEFMHQASQILAAERGWNERSRVLIRSLADDLHLPEYQFENAVEQLQQGKLDFEDRFSTYEKGFIRYLRRQFEKSNIGVLTAAHEATAIRKARRDFEIQQVRARHLIRQVAEQMNISRVSKLDAVEYVVTLVDENIGQATEVSDSMRGRIFEAGNKWGVDANQVEILIQNRIDLNRQADLPSTSLVLKSTAVLLSVLIMAAIGWLVLRTISETSTSLDDDPNEVETETVSTKAITPTTAITPGWWDKRIVALYTKFSTDVNFASFPHELLKSGDNSQRLIGYENLLTSILMAKPDEAVDAQTMFALMFLEEDETMRRQMAKLVQQQNNEFIDNLPSNIKTWQESWRLLDVLVACEKATLEKRTLLPLEEISIQLTGLSIRDSGFPVESPTRLARRQWQTLQSFCYRQPDRVAQLMDPVGQLTRGKLGRTLDDEHATTMTLLSVRPGTWNRMRSNLELIVETASGDQLREIYLANSRFDDPELQRWLTVRLARRLNIATEQVTATRIDEAIKKKLDLVSVNPDRLSGRWRRFKSLPEVKLFLEAETTPPEFIEPQTLADLIHTGTLALMLREADQSLNPVLLRTIDELQLQTPRDLTVRTQRIVSDSKTQLPAYRKTERRSVPSDIRTFERALSRIGDPNEIAKAKSLAFGQLAAVAIKIPDLTDTQSKILAEFLLSADEISEQVAIEQHAAKLQHWPSLALKIADMLPNHDGSIDQAITCASLLLDLDIKLDRKSSDSSWRDSMQQQMMKRIADGLRHSAELMTLDKRFQWNELRQFFIDYYRIRCQVIGVQASRISAANTPTELASLFAERLAYQHGSVEAGEMRSQLAAARFVAKSELQELALTSELINHLIIGRSKGKQADREASSAIAQIYQNELVLLKFVAVEERNKGGQP